MQVKLFFVTFNLNCGLHTVSVKNQLNGCQFSVWFEILETKSKLILGFLHTASRRL